jgi:dienelactone hydrolase
MFRPSLLPLLCVLALPALAAESALDVKTLRTQKRGDVTVTEVAYAAPKSAPVPASLVTPPGTGPFPAVLFRHWQQGTRSEFLDEALALARAGVVSLLVDASTPADLRHGVDVLASRPEVDRQRLGFVGHGLGASVGSALVGGEPRLRALVLMGGSGDFASKAPGCAVFLQYGRSDEAVPYAQARAFIDAAPEPKLFKFYEGGAELSDAARRDRAQWLRTHLGFAEVPFPGLPMVASPTAPELKGQPLPEPLKLRPVLSIPGMEEVQVRRSLVYTRSGTREYRMDLYLPDGAPRSTRPVVVLAHGTLHPALTPYVRDLNAFSGQARWLAAQGFAVALPELGSPATGPAPEQWHAGLANVQGRVEAALAFLRKEAANHRLDTSRVCLMAFSGGGLWGLSPVLKKQPAEGLKCVAAWYPMFDAPGAPPGTLPRDALRTVDAKKLPPLLVVRAGRDMPPLNAALDAFVQDARGRGAPLTLVELPEAHHGFELTDDVEASREAMRQTARFLTQHLRP